MESHQVIEQWNNWYSGDKEKHTHITDQYGRHDLLTISHDWPTVQGFTHSAGEREGPILKGNTSGEVRVPGLRDRTGG